MSSTYSTSLRIELQGSGENSGTWGTITNNNFSQSLEFNCWCSKCSMRKQCCNNSYKC